MKVRVVFDKGNTAYTYEWPDWWRSFPEVGDVVETPPSAAFPEGGRVATVLGIGSDYQGPLATLVRKMGRCFGTSGCGYREPHSHGFACDASCTVCGGH